MAIKTVFITSGTTFTIPADFGSLVSIEAIGGGGASYSATTALIPGALLSTRTMTTARNTLSTMPTPNFKPL